MNSRKKIFILGICVCLLIAGIMYTAIAGANDGFLDGENDSSQALETKENSGEISSGVSDDSSAAENTDSNGAGKNNQAEQIELSEAQIEEICSQAERYLGLINSEKKIGELTNAQITELKKDYAATGYINLKKLLEITGSIEKDLPMITLAQVEEICKAPNILAIKEGKTEKTPADSKAELIKKFNEIAGAPDWMVQSGFDMEYMYHLNKDGTDYVEITNTWIRRVFKDQTTGEKTINYFFESDRLAVEKAEKEFAEEIKNHPYEGMTFFNYYYKYATAEQKAELDKIKVVVRENEDVGTATSHYYAKKYFK